MPSTAATSDPTATGPVSARHARWQRVGRWALLIGLAVALSISVWTMERVPDASWKPALLGMAPWVIGKYVLCPLRWHSLSVSGRTRRWHLRAYAESELIGLASPAHVGADLWRMHRLRETGMNRPCAVAEVGLDRLVGVVGLGAFVVLTGATLPPQLLVAAAAVALLLVIGGLVMHRMRPGVLAARPLPRGRVLAKGIVISVGYQLSVVALVIGALAALGQQVDSVALLGVFGASQVAGAIPGVHGASPREGALVVGLASLGVGWQAAIGAVALMAVLAWVPAVLIGGAFLGARRLRPATG